MRSLSLLFHTSGSQVGLAALLTECLPMASVLPAEPQGSPASLCLLLCHHLHVQHCLSHCWSPPPKPVRV